jgi:hypothetical protein
LNVYNPSGVLTCTFSTYGLSGYGYGMAISGKQVHVLTDWNSYFVGNVSGTSINFSLESYLPCMPNDLANCPSESILSPAIEASQNGSLTCQVPFVILTSNDPGGMNAYSWSGLGITSAITTQSIQTGVIGVYTRTATLCSGLTDVSTFAVQFAAESNSISSFQSASYKCRQDPPVALGANGLANYTWLRPHLYRLPQAFWCMPVQV